MKDSTLMNCVLKSPRTCEKQEHPEVWVLPNGDFHLIHSIKYTEKLVLLLLRQAFLVCGAEPLGKL